MYIIWHAKLIPHQFARLSLSDIHSFLRSTQPLCLCHCHRMTGRSTPRSACSWGAIQTSKILLLVKIEGYESQGGWGTCEKTSNSTRAPDQGIISNHNFCNYHIRPRISPQAIGLVNFKSFSWAILWDSELHYLEIIF